MFSKNWSCVRYSVSVFGLLWLTMFQLPIFSAFAQDAAVGDKSHLSAVRTKFLGGNANSKSVSNQNQSSRISSQQVEPPARAVELLPEDVPAPAAVLPKYLNGQVEDKVGVGTDEFNGTSEQANTAHLGASLNQASALHSEFKLKSGLDCARIALVVDVSGSMGGLFSSGAMQTMLNRVCPLLVKMTSSDSCDCWVYASRCKKLPVITADNLATYVKDHIAPECFASSCRRGFSRFRLGGGVGSGNCESTVMSAVAGFYGNSTPPTIVVFVTDTGCDYREVSDYLSTTSRSPIFWQFVGFSQPLPPLSAGAGYVPRLSMGTGPVSPLFVFPDLAPQFLSPHLNPNPFSLGRPSSGSARKWDTIYEIFEQKCDNNLANRAVKNSGFFPLDDYAQLSDRQIVNRLLSDFPVWAHESERLGIIPPAMPAGNEGVTAHTGRHTNLN